MDANISKVKDYPLAPSWIKSSWYHQVADKAKQIEQNAAFMESLYLIDDIEETSSNINKSDYYDNVDDIYDSHVMNRSNMRKGNTRIIEDDDIEEKELVESVYEDDGVIDEYMK